jgi:hypothetical protein
MFEIREQERVKPSPLVCPQGNLIRKGIFDSILSGTIVSKRFAEN